MIKLDDTVQASYPNIKNDEIFIHVYALMQDRSETPVSQSSRIRGTRTTI